MVVAVVQPHRCCTVNLARSQAPVRESHYIAKHPRLSIVCRHHRLALRFLVPLDVLTSTASPAEVAGATE